MLYRPSEVIFVWRTDSVWEKVVLGDKARPPALWTQHPVHTGGLHYQPQLLLFTTALWHKELWCSETGQEKKFKGKCSSSVFLFFEIAQASLGFTLQFRLALNFWPSFYLKLPSTRVSGSTHHTCLYPSSSSSSSFPSLDDKLIALLFTIYLQDDW